MATNASLALKDHRSTDRDEVHFRANGYGPDAQPLAMVIVNISAMGLMARCDADLKPDQRICIQLPIIGTTSAVIRWALGGRIGCELDRVIDRADYYALLAVMLKSR